MSNHPEHPRAVLRCGGSWEGVPFDVAVDCAVRPLPMWPEGSGPGFVESLTGAIHAACDAVALSDRHLLAVTPSCTT